MKLKKQIFRNYINMFGLKTKQKIVVIESDDWGSIRMPNKKTYDKLQQRGIKVDACPYSKFDCLESEEDLNVLFNQLSSIDSKYGKAPIITANYLTANPDFDKIRNNQFLKYDFENIEVTYSKFNNIGNIKSLIKKGIENRFLKPQYHGREHLNIAMWMELLKNNKQVKEAFNNDMFALSFSNSNTINLPYMASFMKFKENDEFNTILDSGLIEFQNFFGFQPNSFIAPVYIWNRNIENHLRTKGINTIQGLYFRKEFSCYNDKNPKKINRNYNSITKNNQLNLVRNCFFEPSTTDKLDWVNECLKDIEVSFRWSRPAIICSHRINYVGGISEKNRNNNLKLFDQLLSNIIKKWPDVLFISSDEVNKYYSNAENN